MRTRSEVIHDYWFERGRREDGARGVLSRDLDMPAGTAPPDPSDWLDLCNLMRGVDDCVLRMWRDLHYGTQGCVTGDMITRDGVMITATRAVPAELAPVASRYGLTPALAIAKLTEMYLQIDENIWDRAIKEEKLKKQQKNI